MNCFDRKVELAEGLETENLRILYYAFPNYFKGWYYSYEYYRICTILQGSKSVEIDDKKFFTYNKDQFVILPPDSRVSMEMRIPTSCFVLEVSDKLINFINSKVCDDLEIDRVAVDKKFGFLYMENTELISDVLNRITRAAFSSNSRKKFLIDLYGQELVFKILNSSGAKNFMLSNPGNQIAKAIEIMKKKVKENLNVAEIARSLDMSPALFSIKFKKITGLPPNAYFTEIKLNEAKEILKTSSVTETAYELGYDSISYFIKLFSEKFGTTPKQYQLQFLQKPILQSIL